MKKLLLLGCLALAGCGNLPSFNLQGATTLNTVEGVVAAYGTALAAETTLKNTPLCKTGTSPSITNICVKRSSIVKLQQYDLTANTAVNKLVAFVKNNPSVSPGNYLTSAQEALTDLQATIATTKAGD